MAKTELLATIRDRYRSSSRKEKSRILDEFIAVTGHHRKHGIRLLGKPDDDEDATCSVGGRRIYDEAVRAAVIVIWEAADRICGKRLKAALPHLVESMERHGHLALDPEVRERLLVASAATLYRLLKPIRPTAGSRRKRRRRQSMGKRIPVRTYNDWNGPPPGFLEIDLVAHCGGPLSGSFIHSLVTTDICTGWTEAVPLLAREQSLIVEGLGGIGQRLPFRIRGTPFRRSRPLRGPSRRADHGAPLRSVASVRELLLALVQVDRQDPGRCHHRQALQSAHHTLRPTDPARRNQRWNERRAEGVQGQAGPGVVVAHYP